MKGIAAVLLAACAEAMAAPPAPARIATESESVVALAADGERVYWATRFAVRSAPVAGGEPTTLATLPEDGAGVAELRVTRSAVVWATDDAIYAAALAGGKPRRLARARGGLIRGIASDGERLFWVQHPAPRGAGDSRWTRGGAVMAVALPRGKPYAIARNVEAPLAVAVAGGQVYWPSGLSIFRAPVGGGRAVRVLISQVRLAPFGRPPVVQGDKPVAPPRIRALTVDAGGLTWQVGDIQRAPHGGGDAVAVPGLTGLFGAGDDGYYQGRDGDLVRIPLAGGEPVVLARGVGMIDQVALAPDWVYFAAAGALLRLPRPPAS